MQEQTLNQYKIVSSAAFARLSEAHRIKPVARISKFWKRVLKTVAFNIRQKPSSGFTRHHNMQCDRYVRLLSHSAHKKALLMAVSNNVMAGTIAKIFIGKGEQPSSLALTLVSLLTGATGTGKTLSL